MKAVLTVKLKEGFLVFERDIESIASEEVCSGSFVEDSSYSYRDKIGRIIVDTLDPPKKVEKIPAPATEVKDDIPF